LSTFGSRLSIQPVAPCLERHGARHV
jgi:hypothetical protein